MKKIYFLLLALGLFTGVNAQVINIPDANFKMWLRTASGTPTNISQARDQYGNDLFIDANHDNEIQLSEAQMVYELRIVGNLYDKIISTEGIQYFTNLRVLFLDNNLINTINLSQLVNLKILSLSRNQLSGFNFTGLNNLEIFWANSNNFTTLDFTSLSHMRMIDVSYNALTSINVSGLTALENLTIAFNNLNTINLSGLMSLYSFQCYNNHFSSFNLSGLYNLNDFRCQYNQLTSLDVSDSRNLVTFQCQNNNLTHIFIKNGTIQNYINFDNNPNLQFICLDENELATIEYYLNQYGYTNCALSSYCSFTPGGVFYTIQGKNKLDSDLNGCDLSDPVYSNLKFNITNGTTAGTIISNASGNYSIPVQAGTYTITPIFENPDYFNVSSTSVNVDFPSQTSPFNQDFCITPNGLHKDLEITLLPIIPSRPGFNAKFKMIYKNKGTVTQSGSIVVDYFNNLVGFVSSNPALTSQSANYLTWDFTNLQPLETREIDFIVHINSGTDTPPVNIGDNLSFESYIYPVIDDLIPNDNHTGIRQVVVGSYDPNDKTCLEGTTIPPSKVGDYVHYMIRFENTGTANAQNIVVKDMIDTAKFDINTLIPIKGSHSFVANITSGNKVEFIFENINLPFDDANNDGYVAFKIKTKPTLVLGDTFTNNAGIYFDYNAPIVTNTATTTIAALSVQDFEFSDYFNVYPNPVHDVLNISTKQNIEVSSVNIYNMLGQLVLVIPNAKNTKSVDVSSLKTGNYFIKINSDKGTSNTKFIKN